MKKLVSLFCLFLLLGTEFAQAQVRPPPYEPGRPGRPGRPVPPPHRPTPPPPGYGDLICRADDAGHEEHWGGHRSCGECLARHGECIETCDRVYETHTCTYRGTDRYGYSYDFTAIGRTRYEADQNAQWECQRSGYRYCAYNGCTVRTERDTYSRRSCR